MSHRFARGVDGTEHRFPPVLDSVKPRFARIVASRVLGRDAGRIAW